jgi:tetratricopeptide (TPR) repeat protein
MTDELETPGAEDWKRAGDLCLEREDYDGALEAYFEALSLEPEHPAVRYNLGIVHLERHAYPEAIAMFRGVLASRPTDHEVLTSLGWAQLWNHDPLEAAKAFRRALLHQPKFAPAFVGLGWAHMAEAPPALGRAADAFAKAISLETDDPEAYHGLAAVCELRQEPVRAVPLLEQALRQWPDDSRALEGLARVHELLGEWEQAATYLMRLAHQDKTNPDFPKRLACLFDANGAPDRATVFWRNYRLIMPDDPAAAAALGETLLAADRPEEAIEALVVAANHAPTNAEAQASLGHAYFYARRYPDAVNAYTRATHLEPNSATHFYNLGNAYAEALDAVLAVTAYHRALALDPSLSVARVGLGWACYAQGNFETARECFDLVLKHVPDDVAALDGMGSVSCREGRFLAALPYIERARALDPAASGLRLKLGMIYEELGRYEEARGILSELVSGSYAEDRAHEALARVEERLGAVHPDTRSTPL